MKLHLLVWMWPAMSIALGDQPPQKNSFAAMSAEIRALTQRAARSVVEIQVMSYGSASEEGTPGVVARQQSVGSGVIVDAGGYIVTNAHVVSTAIDVKVLVNPPNGQGADDSAGRVLDAHILGVDREADLALLKVEANGLPAMAFAPAGGLRQGDLVLAIGNPMGLRNSVSLGVVSATARAVSDGSPVAYVQTDASINPGNSGGALIDAEGRLVGINTFILTRSGGSEGLGFAIPVNIVQDVYTQLREKGHVDRGEIGVVLEDLSPALRSALGVGSAKGVLVADVVPESPAQDAGLKIGDVLLAVNGHQVESVNRFRSYAYFTRPGTELSLEFMRGEERLKGGAVSRRRRTAFDPLSLLGSPEKNLIPRLGVLGLELSADVVKALPPLREESGVLVVARAAEGLGQLIDVQVGDVIHGLNGRPIESLESLRQMVGDLKPGAPVALQVEREGRMQFIAFLIE